MLLYIAISAILFIIFILIYTWFYIKNPNDFIQYKHNEIIIYYDKVLSKQHKLTGIKLNKYIDTKIIKDHSYKSPTVIYYNNGKKEICPENKTINTKYWRWLWRTSLCWKDILLSKSLSVQNTVKTVPRRCWLNQIQHI